MKLRNLRLLSQLQLLLLLLGGPSLPVQAEAGVNFSFDSKNNLDCVRKNTNGRRYVTLFGKKQQSTQLQPFSSSSPSSSSSPFGVKLTQSKESTSLSLSNSLSLLHSHCLLRVRGGSAQEGGDNHNYDGDGDDDGDDGADDADADADVDADEYNDDDFEEPYFGEENYGAEAVQDEESFNNNFNENNINGLPQQLDIEHNQVEINNNEKQATPSSLPHLSTADISEPLEITTQSSPPLEATESTIQSPPVGGIPTPAAAEFDSSQPPLAYAHHYQDHYQDDEARQQQQQQQQQQQHRPRTAKKLTDLKTRFGPSVLVIAVVAAIAKILKEDGWIFIALFAQAGMYQEVLNVVTTNYISPANKWWIYAIVSITLNGPRLAPWATMGLSAMSAAMGAIGVVANVLSLQYSRAGPDEFYRVITNTIYCLAISSLLLGPSSYWIAILEDYGLYWLVMSVVLVAVNDTMAYFCGYTFGKTSLLPFISKNKTWEGFLGGAFFTTLVGMLLMRSSIKDAFFLSLLASLIAPFGGFLASIIKRAYNVKDYGNFMPGHGGIVDRLDCHLLMAPLCYFYLSITRPPNHAM